MAKSKELLNISDTIIEKYGNIAIPASQLKDEQGIHISTGLIGLDIALNGGILEGTWTHIGGMAKVGKSSLCLTFAASAQKAGKTVYYIDVEGRIKDSLLSCIDGLNKEKLVIIRAKDKILNAEDYLSVIESTLRDDPGCVVFLDSIAVMANESEMASEMGEMQRASIPKLMYKLLRKIAPIFPTTKSTLVTITHMQANPTGYGSPFREVGGNAANYGASYWMTCISATKVEKNGKSIGKDAKFKILAVADGPPDAEPIIPVRFGKGCDKYADMAQVAEDTGLIIRSGAWYEIKLDDFKKDGKYLKVQGIDGVIKTLESEKGIFDALNRKIREIYFGKEK